MRIDSAICAAVVSTLVWVLPTPSLSTVRGQEQRTEHRIAASPNRTAPVRFEPGEDRAGVPTAVARVAGAIVVFSSAGADSIVPPGALDPIHVPSESIAATSDPDPSSASRCSLTLEGGLDGLTPSFEEPLPGVSNYLLSDDRSRWRRCVPGFARVRFRDVAPGIDVVYSSSEGKVNCELVISPNADPDGIRLRQSRQSLDRSSNARPDDPARMPIMVPPGAPRFPGMAPEVSNGESRNRADTIAGKGASPRIARPVARESIPEVLYSTYFGGNSNDYVQGLTVDAAGFIYVSGYTFSTDLPVSAPYQSDPDVLFGNSWDAFLLKFDPNAGAIVFATYLGGSGQDVGFGVALDSVGNIYLTGNTTSSDFPTERAYQEFPGDFFNCFAAKMTPSGDSIVYSTYLGGSAQDGTVDGFSIAVDYTGSLFLSSLTSSTDFPMTADFRTDHVVGNYDIFVLKLLPGGSLSYSALFGGSGFEHSFDLAIDDAGRACVTGATLSLNFPMVRAFQSQSNGQTDAFVTVLDPAGTSVVCSSYLGGSGSETALAVEFDGQRGFYVGGGTTSLDFPTRYPLFPGNVTPEQPEYDAFLFHFDALSGKLFESTLLGGLERDAIEDITLGDDGLVYICGFTRSPDFPLERPFQTSIALPHADGFVAAIDFRARELVFSTFIGAEDIDVVRCVRVDGTGRVILAGDTWSDGFPVVRGSNSIDTRYYNAFVTVIGQVDPPPPPEPPHVDSISPVGSAGSAFTLRVSGSNLQAGIQVFVATDATPWPDVKYRDDHRLVLRKGSPLRDRFPRGVPVEIRFRNPDGGEAVVTYSR